MTNLEYVVFLGSRVDKLTIILIFGEFYEHAIDYFSLVAKVQP
jgi:hypothetical protein